MGETSDAYLTAVEVAKLAELCDTATFEDSRAAKQCDAVLMLAYAGLRFGELTGLNVEDVDLEARRIRVRRSITQLSGRLIEGPPKSRAGRRSVPIPERLVPILKHRIKGRTAEEPAIMSPKRSRLGLENWKRAAWLADKDRRTRASPMRVHDLRHTYAALSRSAGADMKLLQVTMGHASIMVTAHTYADLYDSDLDRVANALDGPGD